MKPRSHEAEEGRRIRKLYRGVQLRRWGKWVAEVRCGRRLRIWLGSYFTPEAAARAYDTALLCLKGSNSPHFNFPDSSRGLPIEVPSSDLSPKSIQRTAAAVGSAFDNLLLAATKDSPTHDHRRAAPIRPEVESEEEASIRHSTHSEILCEQVEGSEVRDIDLQRCIYSTEDGTRMFKFL